MSSNSAARCYLMADCLYTLGPALSDRDIWLSEPDYRKKYNIYASPADYQRYWETFYSCKPLNWSAQFAEAYRSRNLVAMGCFVQAELHPDTVREVFSDAFARNNSRIVALLLAQPRCLEVLREELPRYFYTACGRHQLSLMKQLLSVPGIDANTRSKHGDRRRTPLIPALSTRHGTVNQRASLALLRDHGADFFLWARREDLVKALIIISQVPASTEEALRAAPSSPLLATVLRDPRMQWHEGDRYIGEYGGMVAMFL